MRFRKAAGTLFGITALWLLEGGFPTRLAEAQTPSAPARETAKQGTPRG